MTTEPTGLDATPAGDSESEAGAARGDFPPIADYAFLSDCETCALIASAAGSSGCACRARTRPVCSARCWTAPPASSASSPRASRCRATAATCPAAWSWRRPGDANGLAAGLRLPRDAPLARWQAGTHTTSAPRATSSAPGPCCGSRPASTATPRWSSTACRSSTTGAARRLELPRRGVRRRRGIVRRAVDLELRLTSSLPLGLTGPRAIARARPQGGRDGVLALSWGDGRTPLPRGGRRAGVAHRAGLAALAQGRRPSPTIHGGATSSAAR